MLSTYFYQGYDHYFDVTNHVRKVFFAMFHHAYYSFYLTVPLIPFDIHSDDESSDDDQPPFYPAHYKMIKKEIFKVEEEEWLIEEEILYRIFEKQKEKIVKCLNEIK